MLRESSQPFADGRQAGGELAGKLKRYTGRDDVVVLALPRGGVPVAFDVAEARRPILQRPTRPAL
jgi:putative phosphoribosyl transferase